MLCLSAGQWQSCCRWGGHRACLVGRDSTHGRELVVEGSAILVYCRAAGGQKVRCLSSRAARSLVGLNTTFMCPSTSITGTPLRPPDRIEAALRCERAFQAVGA